jgi:undecaprenyl pyrophosphate phosphatase UppP
MSTILIVISAAITAVATVFIARYARSSNMLSKEFQNLSKLHKQELSDLYQAIVIATLMTYPHGGAIEKFNKMYKGKTVIFKES